MGAVERVQLVGSRQHGMGICNGELIGQEAAHGFSESGGAAAEQVQPTRLRQHGMVLCNVALFRPEAAHCLGESGGATGERIQSTGSRQLCMGFFGAPDETLFAASATAAERRMSEL